MTVCLVKDQDIEINFKNKEENPEFLRTLSRHCWPGKAGMGLSNWPGRAGMSFKELN